MKWDSREDDDVCFCIGPVGEDDFVRFEFGDFNAWFDLDAAADDSFRTTNVDAYIKVS